MTQKKKEAPNIESDDDFLDGIDNLEELKKSTVEDESTDEDFDFDGHDVELNSIPSWVDGDANKPAEQFKPEDLDTFDEGFTLNTSESYIDDNFLPDSSDLFGPASSTSLEEISAVEEQRDAYLEALRQLQADFENYKKRVVRDNQEYAEMKSVKLMEEILPVLDNFQLALKNIEEDDPETEKLKKGIELVFSELYGVLERQGLETIDAEGALFDPEFHDAVTHEDNDEHEQEIVVEVLRPGYKVRGRVVRPAMVKVAK